MKHVILFLFIFFSNYIFCQNLYLHDLGNAAYEKGNYREALHYYKKIEQNQLLFKRRNSNYLHIANCYRYLLVPDSVAIYQIKYFRTNRKHKNSLLDAAENYKKASNQMKAIKYYKKYSKKGRNYYYAQQQIQSFEITNNWDIDLAQYSATLEPTLSSEFYDFSPCLLDDDQSLIFSSSRCESDPDLNSGNNFGVYSSLNTDNKWSQPKRIDTIGESFNSAVVSIDNKRKVLFITKCSQNDKMGKCNIHYTFLKGNLIGETFEVPLRKDHESYTVYGHPSFSTKLQVLFFVSDRKGGYGGNDIWYSKYNSEEDSWGDPINMGAGINSSEDELFPYIAEDGTLYYSSKGGITLGGMDIFRAKMCAPFKWQKGINLQYPFNSTYDDFGIIFTKSNNAGYFTSNRKGGLGYDDIYSFKEKGANISANKDPSISSTSILESIEEVFNNVNCFDLNDTITLTDCKLFPNPTNGIFNIEFNSSFQKEITVRVFNTFGTIVYNKLTTVTKGVNIISIDISNNASAIYYIQILDACHLVYSDKLIKQN